MSTPEAVLRVESLSKRYGDVTVLRDVSFELEAGTVALVTGTNGAGKSTLLRCLAGLASFCGSASFRGVDLPGDAGTRRHLGYLPQDVAFPDSVTVTEVLELFSGLRGAAVDSAGLADGFLPAADAPVRTLSGGQRQRLAIAIALLGRPHLLLLDEPTANLDAWARAELWTTLEAHRRAGTTVVIASPRQDEVPAAGNVVLELDAGSIALRDQAVALTIAGGSR